MALSVLAMVSSAPPAQKKSGKGKGKGGKGADANASHKDVLLRIVPLIANIERRTGQLEDRASFVVILKDEDMKKQLVQVRLKWKEQDPNAKETEQEAEAAASQQAMSAMDTSAARAAPAAHPMGGPQRAVVFKALLELVVLKLPAGHPDTLILTNFSVMAVADMTKVIFRAKPRHYEPMDERNWIWGFIKVENMHPDHAMAIEKLCGLQIPGFRFAPQHTQDGPLIKWLMGWLKAVRKGQAEGDDDDAGSDGRRRPTKQGRRR
jgi:hypothetical protein